MNFGRLAMTAVVAMVANMIYGFLVYGLLLGASFDQYPGVFRGSSDTSHMGYLAFGVLIMMFPSVFIYARGYEGRGALGEGARFGCVMGTLFVGYSFVHFAILNIGMPLSLKMAAASFAEWVVVGVVIALVANLPAPANPRAVV